MTIKTESSEEVSLTNFQWAQIEGNEFVHVAQIGVVVKNDDEAAIENKCCLWPPRRRRFSSAFVWNWPVILGQNDNVWLVVKKATFAQNYDDNGFLSPDFFYFNLMVIKKCFSEAPVILRSCDLYFKCWLNGRSKPQHAELGHYGKEINHFVQFHPKDCLFWNTLESTRCTGTF